MEDAIARILNIQPSQVTLHPDGSGEVDDARLSVSVATLVELQAAIGREVRVRIIPSQETFGDAGYAALEW